MDHAPLGPGAQGEPVRDLHRRLVAAGFTTADDGDVFGAATTEAVEAFQRSRGLTVDGTCDRQTWSALVEAGYALGDRLLYHRAPMLRGDDVAALQRQLAALGFDAGRVDGFFGPDTEGAVAEFQRNAGLTTDGVCGRDTLAVLARLGSRTAGDASGALVRQAEALRRAPRSLAGRRVAIGERGGLQPLLHALNRALTSAGTTISVLHHPDPSRQAAEANDFGAEIYLCLELLDERCCDVAYFAVEGFESVGGRRLAELVADRVATVLSLDGGSTVGMRLPELRETRMPAVTCRLGPPALVVARTAELAVALEAAVQAWVEAPLPS